MRTVLPLLLSATLATLPFLTDAAVWRVNNNPALVNNCDHCFTDLQAAASDPFVTIGDTLHLEPSPVSYGDLTLTKRLVIIGPGYRLGQGTANNQGLQANNSVAMTHAVSLNLGSEGSKFAGVTFGDGFSGSGLFINNTNNITLDRNFYRSANLNFYGTGISGFVITRSYFDNSAITQPSGTQVVSNLIISNNYFGGNINLDPAFSSVSITNNVFNWNGQHTPYGAEVKNNIFVLGSVAINNNDIHHNAASGANGLPAGNSNLNSVVFTNVFDPSFTSDDQKWRLSPTYLTYMNLVGDDLTEPGMYGGATPYRPSGVPAIPAVYQLAAPNTAIQGDPINVTIGTRSND